MGPVKQPISARGGAPIPPPRLVRQSEDIIMDNSGTMETIQETVTFHDENAGYSVGQATTHPSFVTTDDVNAADLKSFLSRPVRIQTIAYTETNVTGDFLATFNPWHLFFNTNSIKYKLNNFSFIRCNLKLKLIVNASPFYYGAAIAAYQPLPNFTPSTIVSDTTTRQLIPYSQRPHLWMYPQNSQGGEMVLPFFYPKSWLPIKVASEFTDMGKIDVIAYAPMRSANGVVGQGMTITVYAWAEDVVLSSSTIALSMQSKDEYGDLGPVSLPATAIANAAGMLRNVPVIGKYATATQIGAGAIAKIASLFGFTNVPVLAESKPFRPNMLPPLAAPDMGYPVEKLTLDSKNELSIDPCILGIPNEDELNIVNFVTKDSYYFQTTWATTDVVDTILAYCRVTPFTYDTLAHVDNSKVYYTPMAYVTNLFQSWRGDIIYSFKIIKSPFHRGRLRISYDPLGDALNNLVTTADTSSVVFTQIIDLGTDDLVEMRIPYQQALTWLQTNRGDQLANIPYSTSTTPTFNVNNEFDNGCWTVRVMNVLSAPVATAPISILVSVRAADNFEFANPIAVRDTVKPFAVQSRDEIETPDITANMGNSISGLESERSLVNFGEAVRSLRPLMRRANYVQSLTSVMTAGVQRFAYRFHKVPPYDGFDPAGESTALGLISGLSTPYNYTRLSAYHWMSLPFVAYKGSMIWHFNDNGGSSSVNIRDLRITRTPHSVGNNSQTASSTLISATSASSIRAAYRGFHQNTMAGVTVTNQETQAGLSVSMPNYTNYLMQSTAPGNATAPTTVSTAAAYDGAALDCFELSSLSMSSYNSRINTTSLATKIDVYAGIGTDFNLYFFLNCPVLYKQFTVPTPV
jgi:hypothetical protein